MIREQDLLALTEARRELVLAKPHFDFTHGQPAPGAFQLNDRVGAPSPGERQAETVVVEIARLAKATIKRAGRRILAFAEQEQPGIDRRAEIVVARVARIPRLDAAANRAHPPRS